MDKIQGRFGFLSYFINGQIRRLPVEFFVSSQSPGGSLMAWLDSGDVTDRPFTPVLPQMDHQEIGGFAQVMSLYEDEVPTLFVDARFWQQSAEHNSGLLFAFQVLHQMRITGHPPALAVEAALTAANALRRSESQILADVIDIYAATEESGNNDAGIVLSDNREENGNETETPSQTQKILRLFS
jgi:hypothetical protein